MISKWNLLAVTITMLALGTSLLNCVNDRYEQKRLIDVQRSSSFEGESQTTRYYYYYNSTNPELLDSLRVTVAYNGGQEYLTHVYHYNGTINYLQNQRQIEYYYYETSFPENSHHFVYQTDSQGRILHNRYEYWSPSSNSFLLSKEDYRHYNSAGYVDSLYRNEGAAPYSYTRSFDNAGMLEYTYISRFEEGQWYLVSRYHYIYPSNPIQYDSFLRFDNMCLISFGNSFLYEDVFNPRYYTSSIVYETWNGSQWAEGPDNTFFVDLHAGSIILSHESGGDVVAYYFNLNGDITTTSGFYPTGGSSTNYTWDVIVPVEDDILPKPNIIINAYPNPMHTCIILEYKLEQMSRVGSQSIQILNVKGQLVRSLYPAHKTVSTFSTVWDGKDDTGLLCGNGIYLVRFSASGKQLATKKITLLN
jgi:hypothetical protein